MLMMAKTKNNICKILGYITLLCHSGMVVSFCQCGCHCNTTGIFLTLHTAFALRYAGWRMDQHNFLKIKPLVGVQPCTASPSVPVCEGETEQLGG